MVNSVEKGNNKKVKGNERSKKENKKHKVCLDDGTMK